MDLKKFNFKENDYKEMDFKDETQINFNKTILIYLTKKTIMDFKKII
jgi:hypothetical protein